MTREYLIRPSKEQILALPEFKGLTLAHIHLIQTTADQQQARDAIFAATHIGFDTESKPCFKVGEKSSGPHIVQIATAEQAFIFSLANGRSHALLAEIVASPKLVRLGFGLNSDTALLQHKLGVKVGPLLELSRVVKALGYKEAVGLKAAVAILLGEQIRKSRHISTSNWAAEPLSPAQLLYAANDAYACWRVYQALQQRGLISG